MIDKLRKRMILISSIAVLLVFGSVFLVLSTISIRQLNVRMDQLTDRISDGNGAFLPFDQTNPMPRQPDFSPGFFTEETPFSTRFFTVWYDTDGEIVHTDLNAISSVTEFSAGNYAETAIKRNEARGWVNSFRYKVFDTEMGKCIVFVDGSMNRSMTKNLIATAAVVLFGAITLILFLIIVVSKRAVSPIAQSYEKQKQFVTDANHELKTPLTLILTNIDIVEQEKGPSEWLDDIRVEGQHMSELISQLTALSRLDESTVPLIKSEFSFTDVCNDTISEFSSRISQKGLTFTASVQPGIILSGDEASVRRLVSILIDNAVKYCDHAGMIRFSMEKTRNVVLTIENSYAEVGTTPLDRLFDRFYRADKARTAGTGFGIGLSLAKSIAEAHKGSIRAYQAGTDRIGFRIILK